MFRMTKLVTGIEAAHQLTKMPAGHKCGRMHGHSYSFEVTIIAKGLDSETKMVLDFGLISSFIKERYDHRLLNDLPEFEDGMPTAEALALTLAELIDLKLLQPLNREQPPSEWILVERVRVSETAGSWVEWTREEMPQ